MPNVGVSEYGQGRVFDVVMNLPKEIDIEIGKTRVS